MTISMAITEIHHTRIINGNYVKIKIFHNSENLKPSWTLYISSLFVIRHPHA